MMKKWMAVMATLALMSTNAFALGNNNGPVENEVTVYLAALLTDTDTIVGENDSIAITVEMTNAAYLDLYIYDKDDDSNMEYIFEHGDVQAGTLQYAWNGHVDNDSTKALLDGGDDRYVLKAVSIGENDERTSAFVPLTITNTPEVSNLTSTVVKSGDVVTGHKFTFSTNTDSKLTAVITKNGSVVKEFAGFTGDTIKTERTFELNWDLKDYANKLVEDGTYTLSIEGVDRYDNAFSKTVNFSVTKSVVEIVQINNLTATPIEFAAHQSSGTEITFDVSNGSNVTVEIFDGSTVIKTFDNYINKYYPANVEHSLSWDGKLETGFVVADGTYTVKVTADHDGVIDTATTTVKVETTAINNGLIQDFKLDPSSSWDPTDEDLEITFELEQDVSSLTMYAQKGSTYVEIIDDETDVESGEYEDLFWDGTDDEGDLIDGGVWEVTLRADSSTVRRTINVEYEKPTIVEAIVSKTSFDPLEDEFTNLLFKIDTTAVVTVEAYKGSKRKVTLLDEVTVRKNKWYAVEFDGRDEYGDEYSYGKDWKFKITAENADENDEFDTATVEFDMEEDEAGRNDSNITLDHFNPVIFDDKSSTTLHLNYCIDYDADVYIAIYDGRSTTGNSEIELLDYTPQNKGCYSTEWDVEDEDNRDLKDGLYTYKIITKNGSNRETEIGRFVVGNIGDLIEDDDNGTVTDGDCKDYYTDLTNLDDNNELCQAITWATDEGIIHGYKGGEFKAYRNISRAETLKVVLLAFKAMLLPSNGSDLGFTDVDPLGWYMTYARTAKFLGMLDGYTGNIMKPNHTVKRVEFLKFALEASSQNHGFELTTDFNANAYADTQDTTDWFYKYASTASDYDLLPTTLIDGKEYVNPSQFVQRGEVALVLFRMYNAGLL